MTESVIPKRPKHDSAPLSFAQLQMWLIDQMAPGNPAYSLPMGYHVKGRVNLIALENSFNEIVRRHEALRTTFGVSDGEPLQVIHPELKIKISVIELNDLIPEERNNRLHTLASEEAVASFDLSKLPLIRISLFRLAETEYVLLINVHHIVADGLSMGLMLDELDAFYRVFTGTAEDRPPDLNIQYADFAVWQRETLRNNAYDNRIAFWQRQLNGRLPILELLTDLPRPALQSFKGSNVFFHIPKELAQDLTALAAREGCTLYTALLSAFQVLLHRYSGAEDILIGTPIAVRSPSEIKALIGLLLNVVALRCDLGGNPTFVQLLRRTWRTTLHAFATAGLPFAKVVENISVTRDPSRNLIFQAMLQMLPAARSQIGDLQLSSFYFDLGAAQFDLTLHVYEEPSGYACRFEYCTDLFQRETIDRMTSHFLQLLSAVVTDPRQRISDIQILTESEKRRMLVDWNNTFQNYPDHQCLHQLFEHTVRVAPNRVAIECAGVSLTYDELNAKSNQLAHHLIKLGIGPDSLVGICVERSLEMVVGLLGILKAGGAYVPLDPDYPKLRLAFMLQDAQVPVLLTQERLVKGLPKYDARVFCLDRDWETLTRESTKNPASAVNSENLAYVIYTSGSTGQPKGAMNTHKGICNRLLWMQETYQLTEADRVLQKTPFSFDVSVWEFFWPLLTGSRLVIARPGGHQDSAYLIRVITEQKITTLHFVPSLLQVFLQERGVERCSTLKRVICSGEALTLALQKRFFTKLGAELHNLYGPTEAAVDVTYWTCEPGTSRSTVPIGRPIANTQLYILDNHLRPVPIGVPGELHIGGVGLARGYLNRSELTAEKFIPNPFSDEPGVRLYKTGDLTRYLPDGNIEFFGRIDHQVKIRGFRVELGEIESVLREHPAVRDPVVMVREDIPGDKRVVGYVVAGDSPPKTGELRSFLQKKLPNYMVPGVWVFLPALPLTPNGKVDRRGLPVPDMARPELESMFVAPRSSIEKTLAEIWRGVLGVERVGIHDNFFDLGGHSLLAAHLFAQIEKKLGVKLPIAILFQAPTIRELADKIEQGAWKSSWNSLVPIQTEGSRPPLFLIHGAEGNVLLYRKLAEKLGRSQPVYGLQSRGLDGIEQMEPDIKSMAAKYQDEIHSVQTSGPYYLGGYCLGGTIALEIAQRLRKAGESVALLAMFESYNVQSTPPVSMRLKTIHKAQNLYFHIRNLLLSLSGGASKFLGEKFRVELSRFKVHCHIYLARLVNRFNPSGQMNYQHLRVKLVNHHAQAAYQPAPYDGKIVLFKPITHYRGFNDQFFDWGAVATQGVQVVKMPNYPRASLNEPFVEILARKLEAEIANTLPLLTDKTCSESLARPIQLMNTRREADLPAGGNTAQAAREFT